jgi:hypothetical protein
MPAAIAAAVPPEEPPGIHVLSYGFLTGPAKDDRFLGSRDRSLGDLGGRYLVPDGGDDFGGGHRTGIGHGGSHLSERREDGAGGRRFEDITARRSDHEYIPIIDRNAKL